MVIIAAEPRFGWGVESFIKVWSGISPILPEKFKGATSESIGKAMVLNAELTEATGVEELYWNVSAIFYLFFSESFDGF